MSNALLAATTAALATAAVGEGAHFTVSRVERLFKAGDSDTKEELYPKNPGGTPHTFEKDVWLVYAELFGSDGEKIHGEEQPFIVEASTTDEAETAIVDRITKHEESAKAAAKAEEERKPLASVPFHLGETILVR